MAETGPKHRLSSKLMLAAIIVAMVGLIAVSIYALLDMPMLRRGSAGPLVQSSPGKDPPPLIMRPNKTP